MGNAITGQRRSEREDLRRKTTGEIVLRQEGYRLFQKLGEGEFSKVYLSEYSKDGFKRTFACKIMDINYAPMEFVLDFLPRELDILRKVHHPNIIYTYSILKFKSKYYIFTEYAERGDVLKFMKTYGLIMEDQARAWMQQLVLALQYLRRINIAHRDIKAENVLVTESLNVKLADFGFSRMMTTDLGTVVLSNTICGSWGYIAPEIIIGHGYDPFKSDMFSAGVLLFVLLTKHVPFKSNSLDTLYKEIMKRKWKFAPKIKKLLSKEVIEAVTRLIEPDVTRRWTLDDFINCTWLREPPAPEPRLHKHISLSQLPVRLNVELPERYIADISFENLPHVSTSSVLSKVYTCSLFPSQTEIRDNLDPSKISNLK